MVSLISLTNSNYKGNKTIGYFNIFLGTGVGLTIAPLMVSLVISFNINWRYLFILLAVVQVIVRAAIGTQGEIKTVTLLI